MFVWSGEGQKFPTVCTWLVIIYSWELNTSNFIRCPWTFFFVNYITTFNSSPPFWGHSKRSKNVTYRWSNYTWEQQTLQKHSVAPGKPQGSALGRARQSSAKGSTAALQQPARGCSAANSKTSWFWHFGKDMDHFLPDCCQPKLTRIYLVNITGNNPPLKPKSVLIHHSQTLSLQGTSLPLTGNNTFCLQEPLNKCLFSSNCANTTN